MQISYTSYKGQPTGVNAVRALLFMTSPEKAGHCRGNASSDTLIVGGVFLRPAGERIMNRAFRIAHRLRREMQGRRAPRTWDDRRADAEIIAQGTGQPRREVAKCASHSTASKNS